VVARHEGQSDGVGAEAVDGGGAAATIGDDEALALHHEGRERGEVGSRKTKNELRGWGGREGDGGFARGVIGVRTEEGKGDRGATASCSPFLAEAGEEGGCGGGRGARPTRGGSRGTSRGSLSTGGRCLAGSGPRPVGADDVRGARVASRTEGEERG
jgi:hypothetical protein